jgi:SAM-dependent methyltransferase
MPPSLPALDESQEQWVDLLRSTRQILRLNLRWNAGFVRGRTLVIGSGARPFAAIFRMGRCIGIDPAPYHHAKVDILAKGESLPIANGMFDSVVCVDTPFTSPQTAELLAETSRVLRPGGYLLLTTSTVSVARRESEDGRSDRLSGLRTLAELSGFQTVHAYTTRSFISTFVQRLREVRLRAHGEAADGKRFRRLRQLPAAAAQLSSMALDRVWRRRGDAGDSVLVARRCAPATLAPLPDIHHLHFCTYFDQGYLSRGLALYHSLERQCSKPFTLWVLCFDQAAYGALTQLNLPHLRPISQAEFEAGDTALAHAKIDRGRTEYYWTCTPSLILFILRLHPELPAITYVDADLYFFSDPARILDEIARASVLLVEHRFGPALLERLYYGIFNVGLLVFRNDANGLACLRWWRARCLEWCRAIPDGDRFGDQKYLDGWPAEFSGVVVAAQTGVGIAPWNVLNYQISVVGGQLLVDNQPLIFYHFHNFKLVSAELCDPGLADYGVELTDSGRQMYSTYGRAVLAGWNLARQVDPEIPPGFTDVSTSGYGRVRFFGRLVRRQLVDLT